MGAMGSGKLASMPSGGGSGGGAAAGGGGADAPAAAAEEKKEEKKEESEEEDDDMGLDLFGFSHLNTYSYRHFRNHSPSSNISTSNFQYFSFIEICVIVQNVSIKL